MDSAYKKALDSMAKDEYLSITEANRCLRALLYGDFDAGKTTLAGFLVKSKGCIITTDSNWVSLLRFPEIAKKITRYPFEGFSQLKAIALAHTEGIEPWCTYDTVIWDTVSRSIERVILKLLKDKPTFNDQRDKDLQSWTHYGLAKNAFNETLDILNKSNLNVIYTSHIREPSDQDRQKKRFAIRPNLPQECFNLLGQEVSLIGWMHKEQRGGIRKISFEGTNTETAKSQIWTIDSVTYNVEEVPALVRKWREN